MAGCSQGSQLESEGTPLVETLVCLGIVPPPWRNCHASLIHDTFFSWHHSQSVKMSWSATLKVPMSSSPPRHHPSSSIIIHHHPSSSIIHHHHHHHHHRRHHHRHNHHTLLTACIITAKVYNTCVGKEQAIIVVRQQRVLALQRNVKFSPLSHHALCIGSGFHGKPAEPVLATAFFANGQLPKLNRSRSRYMASSGSTIHMSRQYYLLWFLEIRISFKSFKQHIEIILPR